MGKRKRVEKVAEYIDREALEKAMTIAAVNGKDKDRRTWAKAICVLHDMQTADVAPVVHGRWKHMDGTKTRRVCSMCGWDVPEYGKFYVYCPNCGAKMDGGGNDGNV